MNSLPETHCFEMLSREQLASLYNVLLQTDQMRLKLIDGLGHQLDIHGHTTPEQVKLFNRWMVLVNQLTDLACDNIESILDTNQQAANDDQAH